ncbi:type II secretion system F family protein [Streptacidiphilus sp. EB129]|uniref:type II secretion system F family protein n=1 Tax=Streptacidiphilus sp. EB129 TaxID=3156262 RepID=UPI003515D19E
MTAGYEGGTTMALLELLRMPEPVLRATVTGLALCLLGWAAWRLSAREVTLRRRSRLFPGESRDAGGVPTVLSRLRARLPAGTLPPPELLLLPLGLLAAWPTRSPLVAAAAAGAVVPAIRLRRRRRAAVLRERRRTAVVGLCAALAGELRTGATPHQAVEMAAGEYLATEGAAVAGTALDCTVLLAAARFGGSLPGAFRALAELPGAEGAAGIAACWQVASSSGAGLAAGLDRVAEGLRAQRALQENVRAELAGPRSTAALLAALPLFGLLLGAALGADPLRMLLHTPSGLACLGLGAALEWGGLSWTSRIARRAESVR